MSMLAINQFCPPAFTTSVFEWNYSIRSPRKIVFDWLNDPKTFTQGNPFPYRVEFIDGRGSSTPGFTPGVQTAHHGPGMLFSGVIGEVRAPEYRDLQYYYGSYVLSLRFIRPVRLEFFLSEPSQDTTELKLQMTAYVHPLCKGIWHIAQTAFCILFDWNIRLGLAWRRRSSQ